MKLRRIDVLGFKSFRTKTGLEISDGVTAVVGPNGCGKSNIVDAIRWSIGSQSPKDLRGRAMEDVIFAGSENHRPMGFAEVKLTLENDGVNVPVEWKGYPEIAVCRRLFRTGESEYEINGARVRLRDVHQLFLGTGVGAKEAYSIIEQGRIGFIVSARPEERRVLIEEAAGITRYKFQRQSAQRRLDKTRDNLVRVHDVLTEVERQVSSLSRQARKAARWRTLTERRRELEVRQALQRRDLAQEKMSVARANLEKAKSAWQLTKVAHDRAEAMIAERRTQLAIEEHAFNDAMEVGYQTKARRDLLRNNVDHQTRELAGLVDRSNRLDRQKKDQAATTAQAEDDLARTNEALGVAEQGASSLQENLARELATLSDARSRESRLLSEVDAASNALLKARSASVSSRALADQAISERDRLVARTEELSARVGTTHAESSEAQAIALRAEELVATAAEAEGIARSALESARTTEREALAGLEEARRREREASAAAQSAEARAVALEGVLERGEGYQPSVRQVLEAIESGALPGLGRPVAERLRVKPEQSARLSGALGPALDAFVAADLDAVRVAADWAKRNQVQIALVWGESVRGPLTEWCTAAEPVPASVQALLSDVDSGASPLSEDGGRSVGWDGALVRHRAGFVTLGSGGDVGASVVQLAADLDRAREEASHAASVLPDVRATLSVAEDALETALRARTSSAEVLRAAEEAHHAARREHRDSADRASRAARQAAEAERVLNEAAARVASLESKIQGSRAETERLEAEAAARQAEVEAQQAQLPEARQAAEVQADSVTELKASMARTKERVASLSSNRDRLHRTLRAAGVDGTSLLREEAEVQARSAEIEASLTGDRRALKASEDAAAKCDEKLEAARKRHDVAIVSVREAEAETHAARKAHNVDAEGLRRAEIANERAKTELEHAETGLGERFQITVAAAREIAGDRPFSSEDAGELEQVHKRLSNIGAVNPAAEEEYEEAKERFEFLDGQRADLEAAMADLEAAIRKMDKTSRELFGETFEAVNAGFQELFPRLFEGGQGRMELTDPDNLLETGIDIVVQPPGKRLQSMTLLSGGEKALTAVALILSIFRLKPTPFCILDEVDAPLDEANVVRFAEAVYGLSETTQFLVITHNKRTMEVANTLYGVTMEEPGVSKVVGVRMPGRTAEESAAPPH